MTTPSPDKQESLEEIARKLTAQFYDHDRLPTRMSAYRSILSCLRNERERCADITDDIMPIGSDNCYWCERVKKAARAIREGR